MDFKEKLKNNRKATLSKKMNVTTILFIGVRYGNQ